MSTAAPSPVATRFTSDFWHRCFEAVPLPLCVLDQHGIICATNASWRKANEQNAQFVAGLIQQSMARAN